MADLDVSVHRRAVDEHIMQQFRVADAEAAKPRRGSPALPGPARDRNFRRRRTPSPRFFAYQRLRPPSGDRARRIILHFQSRSQWQSLG